MVKRQVMRVLVSILLFIAFTVTSYAWLCVVSDILDGNLEGSALMGYFEGGEGTKEKPYLIKYPYQVYNLAWLQYLGQFNKEDEDGNIIQVYFELIDNINMENLVLPPIGTYDNPFVGHFDGAGHLIYNITVSNYLDLDSAETEFGIVTRPLSVTEIDPEEKTVSVVGFFGVVGALDEQTKKKLANDSNVTEISEKVNAVHDLFLDNVTIRTETMETLAGFFAGYVNASVSNVGVGLGTMYVGEDGMPLSALDMGYAISLYSLIGKYDASGVSWDGLPGVTVGGTDGPDGNTGWGGSMDMYELVRRVSYMYAENTQKPNPKNTYPVTFYNYGYIYYTYTASANQQIAYIAKSSLIPINADTETMFAGTDTYYNSKYPTTSYYSSHNSEIIAANNTGYIVGGGTSASSAWVRVRISSMAGTGNYGGIYKSIGTSTTSSPTISREKLEMLTVTPSGEVCVIKDEYNTNAVTAVTGTEKLYTSLGFARYSDVAESFVNMLSGKTMVYGLRFWPQSSTSSNGISINADGTVPEKIITTGTASFYGTTYENYEFLDGAINFKVSQKGFITTVAGTYAKANSSHSLFNLLEITRDSNNEIETARAIEKIWAKYDNQGKLVDVQYNDDLADTTGYVLEYNVATMNTLATSEAAYYFEIPVKEGDYALCALKGMGEGAYLMYLDIGANGNQISSPTTSQTAHKISDVVFVDDTGIDDRTTEGYTPVVFAVTLGENVTRGHDTLKLVIDRTATDNINYTVTNKDGGAQSDFTVTSKKDDEDLKINGQE